MRGWAFPLRPSLLLPSAWAGSAEAPEVTDAARDATALGRAPIPAAFEWADVQAAWCEADGEDLRLVNRVGDRHAVAGYTIVPGVYSGGFLSRSDENGDVPAARERAGRPGRARAVHPLLAALALALAARRRPL